MGHVLCTWRTCSGSAGSGCSTGRTLSVVAIVAVVAAPAASPASPLQKAPAGRGSSSSGGSCRTACTPLKSVSILQV
jgi:hypothetical protein